MRNRNRLTIFSSIVFFLLFSFSSRGNDREKMNLSGKVKSVTAFEFEAKSAEGKVIKGAGKSTAADDYNYSMFAAGGRFKEQKSLGKEDSLIRRKIYKYNDKDSLIEITILGADSALVEKVKYKRDMQGRTTEVRFTDAKGKTEKSYLQIYDTAKKTMEWIARDENDSLDKPILTPREIYFYDGKGNVKKIEHYTFRNPTTMILGTISTFSYDAKNHLKETIHYFKNDSIREKITYSYSNTGKLQSSSEEEFFYSRLLKSKADMKYDEKGNLTDSVVLHAKTKLKEEWTFKYENDQTGNWIRCVAFHNSSPVKITERKIEYYP